MTEPIPDTGPAAESMVCAVCGRVLDLWQGHGWAHGSIDRVDEDHPAVPVPAGSVPVRGRCDFCFADDPTHVVHTAELYIVGVTADTAEEFGGTDAGWAACDACARAIATHQWNRLLRRTLDAHRATTGTEPSPGMERALRQLHRQIRRHLHGPPQPLS